MLMQHGKNSLWSLCLLLDGSRKGTSDWPFQMGVMGFTLCYPYSRKCHQLPLNIAQSKPWFSKRGDYRTTYTKKRKVECPQAVPRNLGGISSQPLRYPQIQWEMGIWKIEFTVTRIYLVIKC